MIHWLIVIAASACAAALAIAAANDWAGDRYLCDTCRFNDPTSCLKPERPHALCCVSFCKRGWD